MTPAAWSVRELISYDLPQLWPIEQAHALSGFERANQAGRRPFLAHGGVRYCLVAEPPRPGAPPIQLVGPEFGAMAVYECGPDVRRTYVVANASIEPDPKAQLAMLFDRPFDAASTVMLAAPASAPAGLPGAPAPAAARFISDRDSEVTIEAAAESGGGYLVLLDSFDRSWRVEVDGRAAPLLRANALYRAVHLVPGLHIVRFVYRPTMLYVWLTISGLAGLTLSALAFSQRPLSSGVCRIH
jgi:hypothetical protein